MVESRFQSMTGGPKLSGKQEHSVLIEVVEQDLCQFEMHVEDSDIPEDANIARVLMERLAAISLSPAAQSEIINDIVKTIRRTSVYCVLEQFPEEALLVVRRNALTDFISSAIGGPSATEKRLDARQDSTYLNTIAVLLELIQTPNPDLKSAAAVITEMVRNYSDTYGISKSQLEKTFAAANRHLRAK